MALPPATRWSASRYQPFVRMMRTFAFGVGSTIGLVHTRTRPQTTDVSGSASPQGASVAPMTRALLLGGLGLLAMRRRR